MSISDGTDGTDSTDRTDRTEWSSSSIDYSNAYFLLAHNILNDLYFSLMGLLKYIDRQTLLRNPITL